MDTGSFIKGTVQFDSISEYLTLSSDESLINLEISHSSCVDVGVAVITVQTLFILVLILILFVFCVVLWVLVLVLILILVLVLLIWYVLVFVKVEFYTCCFFGLFCSCLEFHILLVFCYESAFSALLTSLWILFYMLLGLNVFF